MKLRGSLLVIVCCLVMEICNINRKEYVLFNAGLSNRVVSLSGLGVLFLLYPLVGHLTDVYLTRYRSLKCSFVMLIILACLGTFGVAMEIVLSVIWNVTVSHTIRNICGSTLILVYVIGLGLFQANAIQFGLDQLLEAPTPKLIAFIHWYYWAQNVGSLVFFYASERVLYLKKSMF